MSDPIAETRAFLASMDRQRAFVWKYREFKDKIFHYFLYRLRGDRQTAEDLSSALFLKTYERFSSYDDRYAFSTWVYAIARNMLIDHVRSARHRAHLPLDEALEAADDERDFFAAMDRAIDADRLQKALAQLPKPQADAVYRRHILLETTADIAARLGKSEEAVRQLVSRGCRLLREQLSAKESTTA